MRASWRRWLAVTTAVAGVAGLAAVPMVTRSPDAGAMGKIQCKVAVGRAALDPIATHRMGRSLHRHIFFSNTKLLTMAKPGSATYSQLVGSGTTCENPDDSAVYWIPDLVFTSGPNAGTSVPVAAMDAYYRSFDGQEVGVAKPIAPDARIIAGNAMAAMPQPTNRVNWGCGTNSSRPGPYQTITQAACDKASGKVRLVAHVIMPSCWDGKSNRHTQYGNTADYRLRNTMRNHYTYPKRHACPSKFPIPIPQVKITTWFSYTGNGQDVALVSDLMMREKGMKVAPGTTLHGDFWNTWRQTGGRYGGLVGMIRDCVNKKPVPGPECGA